MAWRPASVPHHGQDGSVGYTLPSAFRRAPPRLIGQPKMPWSHTTMSWVWAARAIRPVDRFSAIESPKTRTRSGAGGDGGVAAPPCCDAREEAGSDCDGDRDGDCGALPARPGALVAG